MEKKRLKKIGHFWKVFGILKIWIFFHFLEFFDLSTLQGALKKKLRKNHFKTSLDTLGITFGHFWKFENFSLFVDFFESPGFTGQSFSPSKKSIKTCSNNVFGNVFGHVLKVQSLSSFPKFFQVLTLRGALAFFSQNKIPQSKFRTCLDTIRNSFGHFENIEIFQFFFHFFFSRTSRVHWAKVLPKNLPRSMLKTCLNTFENDFGHFEKKTKIPFFLSFSMFRPSEVHWAFFFEKLTSKQVQNLFGHFWKRFPGFWKFECFSIFWNFSTSPPSRVHWPKNLEIITSKQVWTLLESVLDIYESLKFFRFLWIFFESPGCTGQSFSPSKKINQNMLKQCFWECFGTCFKSSESFQFSEVFPSLDAPGCTGLFFASRIPQSKFRTCLDTIWDSFGHFENIEIFQFFFQFFLLSNLQGALSKNLSQNMISKHVQNIFDCFSERFLGILKNWNVFLFFEVLPSFDTPGCTGQFFPRKSPHKSSTTCLDTFRNVFGHFWNFKFFYISSRIFTSFDLQGELVIRNLEKNHLKTNLDTFGNVFGILKIWIFLNFFDVFRLLGPPGCTEGKNFEKITAKQNWTLLESVLDIFEGLKFFGFSRIFLSLQGAMGRAFLRRKKINQNTLKQCFCERFWTSFKSSESPVFRSFSKSRRCVVHWPFSSKKNTPKQVSEHVWTLLATVLDTLEILNFSNFFQSFLLSNLHGALSKNFSKKVTSKHVENVFEHFWERFWAFWKKNEIFSLFPKFFQTSTLQGVLGKIFTKNMILKHVQNMFDCFSEPFLGILKNWKVFLFYEILPKFRPSRVH